MTPVEDRLMQLVRGIAARDEEAMAELCSVTRQKLQGFVRRTVRDPWQAEEVLQDVYGQVWAQAAAFDASRGNPWGWFYSIARSRAIDSLRRRASRPADAELDRHVGVSAIGNPEEERQRNWLTARMRMVVTGLPDAQREVIDLAFYEGYSHSEIADETGVPLGTVKTRIRTALLRIRHSLHSADPQGQILADLPF